jgi:hypothetical protein
MACVADKQYQDKPCPYMVADLNKDSARRAAVFHRTGMKAVLFSAVALLASVACANAAPYVGLEGNETAITLKSSDNEFFPQSTGGWGIHVGDRFGRFAGELGYSTSVATGNANIDNLHLTRMTLDGIVYVPIFGGFNFLLTGGGAETNYGISTYARSTYLSTTYDTYKTTSADATIVHGNEFDWRAGGGFSFGFDTFEVRLLAHYQPLSMANQADNTVGLELGVNIYL